LASGKALGELLGEYLLGKLLGACKLFDERVAGQVVGLIAKTVVPHVEQPIDGASPSQLCTGSNRERKEPLSRANVGLHRRTSYAPVFTKVLLVKDEVGSLESTYTA
jgi:hypothetical protein